ncbi:MAG: hypothetical protein ACKO43_07405, partial [Alphaproteobacteria bacterium]
RSLGNQTPILAHPLLWKCYRRIFSNTSFLIKVLFFAMKKCIFTGACEKEIPNLRHPAQLFIHHQR